MEPGASSSKKVKTLTNWLDLPRELTIQIFIMLGFVDLIRSAESVCSSWRAIARDPQLYRVVDLSDPSKNFEAFAIAGNMNPSLRSLHLYGNLMNNTGLEAILGRFSQLEFLVLRKCFNIDLNEDLLKRCRAIKRFRLPNDSTEDYEYELAEKLFTDYEDDDSDYSHGDFDRDDNDDSDYSHGDSDE